MTPLSTHTSKCKAFKFMAKKYVCLGWHLFSPNLILLLVVVCISFMQKHVLLSNQLQQVNESDSIFFINLKYSMFILDLMVNNEQSKDF